MSPREVLNVAEYFFSGSIANVGGLEYCFGIQIPVYPGARLLHATHFFWHRADICEHLMLHIQMAGSVLRKK